MSKQPTNRQQRICAFVARKPGTDIGTILAYLLKSGTETRGRAALIKTVSAQLLQITNAGKLRRTGKPMAYKYWPTAKTLVDQRTVATHRRGRKKKPAPVQAKPAAVHAAPAPKRRPKPSQASQIRVAPAKPRLDAPIAPRGTPAQTVEQFLAAGGRIQRLQPHEVSQPLRFAHNPSRFGCFADAPAPARTRRPRPTA